MIVLISGKQGSGKSTLAAQLENVLQAETIKFADPLYECHEAIWNTLASYGIKREKKSGDLLQMIGDFGRRRDTNLWVNIAKERAAMLKAYGVPVVIIDDCRFENEFNAFPDAFKIRLECAREVRRARAESWRENDQHSSEVSLDEYVDGGRFDLVIDTLQTSPDETLTKSVTAICDRIAQRNAEMVANFFARKAVDMGEGYL